MTTPAPPAPSAQPTFDWRRPSVWLGLLLIPIDIYLTIALTEKHGLAVGILAGVVYGSLTLVSLAYNRVVAWSKAHPLLDSLILLPLVFLALAYLTPLSLVMCAVITAACGVPWLALTTFARRRHKDLPEKSI
ncbi:hypothetical protein [Sphaerisporangium perillae]|uniref:hypothetical protein n=1 Tax=Sphaerisporangium perillae TaxID=2935860 RepID=UPI00201086DF|nr:hypothetical protein [Sphaerisporangium perillae]